MGAVILIVFGLILSAIILTQKPIFTVLGRKSRDQVLRQRERAAARRGRRRAAGSTGRNTRRGESEERMPALSAEEEEKRKSGRIQEIPPRPDYRELGLADVEIPKIVQIENEDEKGSSRGFSGIPPFLRSFASGLKNEVRKPAVTEPEISEETVRNEVERTREQILSPDFSVDLDTLPGSRSNERTAEFTVEYVDDLPGELITADEEDAFYDSASRTLSESGPLRDEKNPPAGRADSAPLSSAVKSEQKKSFEADDAAEVAREIREEPETIEYDLPQAELLSRVSEENKDSRKHLMDTAAKLEQLFSDFNVGVHITNVSQGPTVTRYELQPDQGVKVARIVSLADDIKLNLAAADIRIEAPIPGKAAVGIEVPNKEVSTVHFRELMESREFQMAKGKLTFAVGKDIGGRPVIADIEKMPHLLIAGATGSGKSVCINTLIMSVLYKARPEEVRMLMIDPKVVELKIYDGIPHLLIPVVTDPKKAAGALNWAVQEMTERYKKFAEMSGVRDIKSYNERIARINEALPEEERQKYMPKILIIVDELADLMMVAQHEVEDAICRLAQLARAAGIHLVIATQRPSVNVVTGLIKANMPSRIALAVSSGVDSRTIIDMNGAEKLLGKGDMLFYPQGYSKPARVQGAFVSDADITNVVKFIASQTEQIVYNTAVEEQINETVSLAETEESASNGGRDELFEKAARLMVEKDKATIGMLQRAYKIGFNRAARIVDSLSEEGIIGPEEGTKPRKVLMSAEELEAYLAGGN
ncbi:MAG: DNA translocase FtsK [Lachnospiraceae bacterium]|nr:DNA translocase FtsK [Lachnospiraceae bacterium]